MKIKMKIYTVACYSDQVFLDIKTVLSPYGKGIMPQFNFIQTYCNYKIHILPRHEKYL